MNGRPASPLPSQQRIPIVDILRGWALFGVAIGNFAAFSHMGASPDRGKDTLTSILEYVTQYLFAAKSWTLLSILFGYGFSVLIQNVANRNGKPASFFLRRMGWLLALAFLNSLFFFGDILRDYAVLGMLLLAFHRVSTRTVAGTSVVLMLIVPFVSAYARSLGAGYQAEAELLIPAFQSQSWLDVFAFNLQTTWWLQVLSPQYAITVHLVMLSCMLLGMAAHRSGFVRRLAADQELSGRIFWWGLALAVVLNASLAYLNQIEAPVLTYFRFGYWGVISTMLATASGICWLYGTRRLTVVTTYLQDAGRMTLTNYMTQCILLALLFSGAGLGLFNTMPYGAYLILAIGTYSAQVFLSRWWLSRFQCGPVEWLWRRQSYGPDMLPIRKQKQASSPVVKPSNS